MSVRRAVPADRPFVLGLASRFAETRAPWRTEAEVTTGTERALSHAFEAEGSDGVLFVAESAGALVGFAYAVEEIDFFTGRPHAHLSEVAAVRGGTGAGAALVAAVEAWARARGSRYLSLHVNLGNTGARALYERAGFAVEYERMVKLLG